MSNDRKLFGTDGVRGIANVEPMTPETALRMGRAVAYLFTKEGRKGRIVIGKDTRLSGYMFEQAMAAGICSMGADVWTTGPLPTPGIAFITSSMRADAGVVISASHNPFQDNGIKIFARDGFKLPDDVESRIEQLMASDEMDQRRPTHGGIGRVIHLADSVGRYIVFLKNTFPRERTLDGFKIVVDTGHGAAYKVAPAVFGELGANVIPIGYEPDGTNINEKVGALHPRSMCELVRLHDANLGIALDGDADRVIVSDEKGNVVDGDAIMALCATRLLARGALKHNTLVATIMSNIGLEQAMARAGGKLVRTPVGDRYVVDEMRRAGYNLGGEQSGHLIFLDHMTTGDGIVAALAVLAVMVEEGRPLSELAQVMQRSPQVLVNVNVKKKRALSELPEVEQMIAAVERELIGAGRVVVRYSGTEAKARVMIEGPDQGRIQTWADEIAAKLVAACDA